MKVLLIAGGWSPEREVSLNGARAVDAALQNLGHDTTLFDLGSSLSGLMEAASRHDFAFINLHGSPGEDGLVQALLNSIGCPYQGSGPSGSFLALNKAAAKELFKRHGLPTPEWQLLSARPAEGWQPDFPFPVFIKDNTGGSSLGMEYVPEEKDLEGALNRLFGANPRGEFLVEPAIRGVEVTCGVLGVLNKTPGGKKVEEAQPLPPILIRPKSNTSGIFDYASKYTAGMAEEICPAPLPAETTAKVQHMALTAHRALGLAGYSRSDFILREDGSLALLETNTLPGMTGTSLVPQEAAAIGLSFEDLIARLVELGQAAKR